MAFLVCVSFVSAEDIMREPQFTNAGVSLYNYPYWIEVNTTGTIITNNPSASYAEIRLNAGVPSNMTNVSGTWRAFVTSTVEEDANLTITYFNGSGSVIGSLNDTLRFRIPFTVTISFFKNSNATSTEVEAYKNEFQYAVMKYAAEGDGYSYTLGSPNSLEWMNKIGRLFPYYKDVVREGNSIKQTQDIYLWARISNGEAEFKVYNNGTYSLSTMNTNVNGLYNFYEFGLPKPNGEIKFHSALAGNVPIITESDQAFNVFISAWEVYKWNATKNAMKIIFSLIVWGVIVIVLSYAMTFWLPIDIRPKAFGTVLGVLAFATSPLLIMAVRILL